MNSTLSDISGAVTQFWKARWFDSAWLTTLKERLRVACETAHVPAGHLALFQDDVYALVIRDYPEAEDRRLIHRLLELSGEEFYQWALKRKRDCGGT